MEEAIEANCGERPNETQGTKLGNDKNENSIPSPETREGTDDDNVGNKDRENFETNHEGNCFECPNIAPGWVREVKKDRTVFYYPPEGNRIDTKQDLQNIVGSSVDLTDFDYITGEWVKVEGIKKVKEEEEDNTIYIGIDPAVVLQTCDHNHNPGSGFNIQSCLQKFLSKSSVFPDGKLKHEGTFDNIKEELPSDDESDDNDGDNGDVDNGDVDNGDVDHGDVNNGGVDVNYGNTNKGESTTFTYNCQQCDYKTNKKYHFRSHVDHKHEGKSYHCDICNKNITWKNDYYHHMKMHKEYGGLFCDLCDYQALKKSALKLHIESAHLGTIFSCEECTKVFKSRKSLIDHNRIHNGKMFKCDACAYSTNLKQSLNNHVDRIHKVVKHKCELCVFDTYSKADLRHHIGFIHENVPLDQIKKPSEFELTPEEWTVYFNLHCPRCQKKFSEGRKLKNHIKNVHLKMNLLTCELCEYTNVRPDEIRKHIEIKHEGKRYICEVCSIPMTSKSYLRQHMKLQHEMKEGNELVCDQCDFRTVYKARLRDHINFVHEGIAEHCSKCQKEFRSRKNLLRHMEQVHPEKGFIHVCDKCPYKTHHQDILKVHLENQHGQNEYICHLCSNSFPNKTSLNGHLRSCETKSKSESDSMPINTFYQPSDSGSGHSCTICDFKSANTNTVKRHIETVHERISYSCDECHKSYTQKSNLTIHKKKKHSIVMMESI